MDIELLPLIDNSRYFDDAVAVYTEYVPGNPRHHRHFFQSHMQRRDYVALVAAYEERIVGVAFGSRSLSGQWWHDKIANQIGTAHPALQDAWELTQLHVLRDLRNKGIGGRLHDALIRQQPCTTVLLSTPASNGGAQRFYIRRGWTVLHSGFAFSKGDEPYMILQLRVTGDE